MCFWMFWAGCEALSDAAKREVPSKSSDFQRMRPMACILQVKPKWGNGSPEMVSIGCFVGQIHHFSCFLPTTSKLPIFTGHLGFSPCFSIFGTSFPSFLICFAHSKLDVSLVQDEDDDLYSDDLRPGQAKGAKAASSAIV